MPISSRSFQRLVVFALAAGFALLVIAAGAVVTSAARNEEFTRWVDHTYEVESSLTAYTALSERLEAARRGYLLQPMTVFAETYADTSRRLPVLLDRISMLTRDNPDQQRQLARLRAVAARHRASVAQSIARMRSADAATRSLADFGIDESGQTMTELRAVLGEMMAAEAALLQTRRAEQQAGVVRLYIVLGIAGVLLLLVFGGAVWVIVRYTRDLNRSGEALRVLNTNLEGAVAERTAELQRANEEIQRFAYIVSHDLRSPLVNVMGFTAELEAAIAPLTEMLDRVEAEAPQLIDADANVSVRQDLPEAIGFIRSSTGKMDRLINAILQLSRLGRRTLTPATVDLVELAETIRAATQHRLVELGADLEIRRPMPAIATDRLALEQILSNLVENAIKYLTPGRPGRITVAGRGEGNRVIIEVSDNGRGIDPRDHERIFELFRRSGTQDQPGEGLGLAHVRALTYRLGGVITCESTLGNGATFRLSLPRRLIVERVE